MFEALVDCVFFQLSDRARRGSLKTAGHVCVWAVGVTRDGGESLSVPELELCLF